MTRHHIRFVSVLILIMLSLPLFAARGSYAQSADTSQFVILTCTGSPCNLGDSFEGEAMVWPASLGPWSNWSGYTVSAGMFLQASIASGMTISLTSGTATVYAGLPGTAWHRVLATLSPGQPYTISGLATGEVVSVQSENVFLYSLTEPCTDPTACDPVWAIPARWRCNIPECQGHDWTGAVINWPSWAAYENNARAFNQSRTVFSYYDEEETLYPYMGSWAEGCQVTAVSGTTLIIEWQRGTDDWRETFLEPGESYTITLAPPEDGAMIEGPNEVLVPFSVSLTNCDPQSIVPAPILVVDKTAIDANGGQLQPGDTINYTIVVSNTGDADANGGLISDPLPANTSFVSGSINLDPSIAGTAGITPPTLASDLTIGAGQQVTVSYAVVVNSPLANGTQISNTASVTSNEISIPATSTVTNTVTSAPTLAIRKTAIDANGGQLQPGDTINYTIVVSNTGDANANGGLISDPLPANTGFMVNSISLNPPGAGTAGITPPTLASDLTIGAGQQVTVTYSVLVNSPLPNGAQISNTASVTSNEISIPATDTVTNTVTSAPVLAIRKTAIDANGGPLRPGDRINYTIVVSNTGDADATGGLLSNPLPANTSFVAGSINLDPPTAGTVGTAPPVLASGLTIPAGQSVAVTFSVLVNSPLAHGAQISNTASVTSSEVGTPTTSTIINTVTSTQFIYLPLVQKNYVPPAP